MLTPSAARSFPSSDVLDGHVIRADHLLASGWTWAAIRAQFDARRWQRVGRAIVLHNGAPTAAEQRVAALINAGLRAALTAFTAAECWGLTGWSREPIDVLVPGGTKVRMPAELDVRIHYTGKWQAVSIRRAMEAPAPALLRATAGFSSARPACGLLAAGVQQRIVTADQLQTELNARTHCRHHAALLLAVHDIAQGAEALSEIDFARLCRRVGLPEPIRQQVRVERDGRRRYLDVEWRLRDGRRLVVEIDGALHLVPRRWWDDQLRQNELMLSGDVVLRFPSVVVRSEPGLVVDQLRRALL